jgi:hypothetical protein
VKFEISPFVHIVAPSPAAYFWTISRSSFFATSAMPTTMAFPAPSATT